MNVWLLFAFAALGVLIALGWLLAVGVGRAVKMRDDRG